MDGRDDDKALYLSLVPALPPADLISRPGQVERDVVLLVAAAQGSAVAWCQLADVHVADVWSWAVEAVGDATAASVCEVVWLRLAQALPMAPGTRLDDWFRGAVGRAARESPGARPVGRPHVRVVDRPRAGLRLPTGPGPVPVGPCEGLR